MCPNFNCGCPSWNVVTDSVKWEFGQNFATLENPIFPEQQALFLFKNAGDVGSHFFCGVSPFSLFVSELANPVGTCEKSRCLCFVLSKNWGEFGPGCELKGSWGIPEGKTAPVVPIPATVSHPFDAYRTISGVRLCWEAYGRVLAREVRVPISAVPL